MTNTMSMRTCARTQAVQVWATWQKPACGGGPPIPHLQPEKQGARRQVPQVRSEGCSQGVDEVQVHQVGEGGATCRDVDQPPNTARTRVSRLHLICQVSVMSFISHAVALLLCSRYRCFYDHNH